MAQLLLIDDADDVREMLREGLTAIGHDVTVARTSAEAMACLVDKRHDLVIADVVLPDRDGTSLAREAERCGIPALLITGEFYASVRLRELGRHCLFKPFSMAQFLHEVEAGLSRQVGVGHPSSRRMNCPLSGSFRM